MARARVTKKKFTKAVAELEIHLKVSYGTFQNCTRCWYDVILTTTNYYSLQRKITDFNLLLLSSTYYCVLQITILLTETCY